MHQGASLVFYIKRPVLLTLLLALGAPPAIAQTSPSGTTQVTVQTPTVPPPADDANWVWTKHPVTIAGKTVNYTATVELMLFRNDNGDIEARMFFTAYHVDGAATTAKRPITLMYIDHDCRVKLHSDIANFIKMATNPTLPPKVKLIGGPDIGG